MRIVVQRVLEASVKVDGICTGKIDKGLLLFAGFEDNDNDSDIVYAAKKLVNLRIFDDDNGVMNHSILEKGGDILLISQFTLFAQTRRGNRPSYIMAAKPEKAIPLYEQFRKELEKTLGKKVETGVFGADMKVSLINDGPVTIWIDTKVDKNN
ncbi:MAG: D-aminoacyl-tRNA deacylase [Rikenellaceae bacterium]|jgi:D-tyrosyl-tRNA(Tyr) deacylase|nr:D-tyrosyl-tRNA(Tyr) deacylase [Bacteroidales bacterium]